MLTARELDRLTEGWPEDEAGFDLALFAGSFRSDRPELSGPALDRVGDRVGEELERRSTPRPSPAMRIVSPVRRTCSRTLTFARKAHVGPRLVRLIPLAAAASVLLGVGVWLGYRPAKTGPPQDPLSATPDANPPRLVKQRPAPRDPLAPEHAPLPVP